MNVYESSGQESGESDHKNERRAHWERFTMVVLDGDGSGYINVRNDSHNKPGDHIHTVHVENGQVDRCTCSHAIYRDAHCKHQIAVENRPLVLSSADAASAAASPATTNQQVATDGGTAVEPTEITEETNPDRPQADHWGQPVEHYNDGPVGAGEQCECQSCGVARFEIALIAATAEIGQQWEEFYECQNCGARGSFRIDETQFSLETQREWTGRMAYPE